MLIIFHFRPELSHTDDDENTEQQRETSLRNAIPLERRLDVLKLVAGRLHDKASLVRKEACRFLTKIMSTHPFWLDGGVLDVTLFQKKLQETKHQLEVIKTETFDFEYNRLF
jgi:hypothetical protein